VTAQHFGLADGDVVLEVGAPIVELPAAPRLRQAPLDGGVEVAQPALALQPVLDVVQRDVVVAFSGDATYGAAQARARGAVARLERAGLELAGGHVFFGAWSEAWGRNATRELLRRAPDIDAIFAGSDQIARGVLDTLDRAGVAVPSQVSVVGFDNWEALAPNSRPPLTTIDMNLQQLGRTAAQRLFAAIAGPAKSGVETLPCRLVARESSLPAD
jgi:LacI family transcriptional regulator